MKSIEDMISYNKKFVEEKEYEKYTTSKYPDKKIAILTCMDTRLVQLLPAALGIKNGDVKIIKNAGAIVSSPFGSAARSILIAVVDLGVTDVMVIGHTDCGVQNVNSDKMIAKLVERGINPKHIDMLRYCGVDLDSWLAGFGDVECSVNESVDILRKHPLIPKDVNINGYVMDSETGLLTQIEDDIGVK